MADKRIAAAPASSSARGRGHDLNRSPPHPLVSFLKEVRGNKEHPLHKEYKAVTKAWSSGKKGKLNLSMFGPDLSNQLIMRNFTFVRSEFDNAWAVQSVPADGVAKHFELDNLPGYTDFTTLFDQYRFTRVDFKLIPRVNVNTFAVVAVTTTAVMPVISVWFDPDDSTDPLLVGESLEVENVIHSSGYHIIEGHFKPKAAIGAYGGAFTQFAEFDGWVDCTSDDTQWYGLKAWVGAGGGSQTTFQTWDAFFVSHVEFRKVR